jgi:hypothetical protein
MKKANSGKIKPKEKKDKKKPVEREKEDKDSSEFGGIPMRDLKKNLGCG